MTTLEIKVEEPVTFVIFGATGDLTRRKLLPALYTLFREDALPENFSIVGFARREHDDKSFCKLMNEALREHSRIPVDEESLTAFCARLHYHRGDLSDPAAFNALNERLNKEDAFPANRLL